MIVVVPDDGVSDFEAFSSDCLIFLPSSPGKKSLAGVSLSALVDLFGGSTSFLGSCPGVGSDAKSLYELSVVRGTFHGKRRSVMQQYIMAKDQISTAVGSYLRSSYTSGARYGSDPTIPKDCVS